MINDRGEKKNSTQLLTDWPAKQPITIFIWQKMLYTEQLNKAVRFSLIIILQLFHINCKCCQQNIL